MLIFFSVEVQLLTYSNPLPQHCTVLLQHMSSRHMMTSPKLLRPLVIAGAQSQCKMWILSVHGIYISSLNMIFDPTKKEQC